MKLTSWIISALGLALVLLGIVLALLSLAGLYAGALSDPMGSDAALQARADPKAVSGAMLRAVGVGGVGVALLGAGVVMRIVARKRTTRANLAR